MRIPEVRRTFRYFIRTKFIDHRREVSNTQNYQSNPNKRKTITLADLNKAYEAKTKKAQKTTRENIPDMMKNHLEARKKIVRGWVKIISIKNLQKSFNKFFHVSLPRLFILERIT